MSAVVLLAIAFGAIALVGTALAAVHDLIAAAVARAGAEAGRPDVRPASAAAGRPRLERLAQRAAPGPSSVRVRVRGVDAGAAPGARA
jgi:hypothetical protein